ncbi:MAG: hypothetical protein BWY45_01780 [Euryarchaeota archaeon ADurb.Bin294]|nr:MAG: hypothetical protein BWY45_01780 [Euryarchaeota archaeon ADurb.Bin294]
MKMNRRCLQLFIILIVLWLSFINSVTAEMVITSFSPESAINTGQVIITLHGTGFQSEQISNILLDQSVTKRYTCSKIVVRSDTELAVTFSLISIEPGPYTIVIKTTKPASYASQMQFKVLFATSPHVVSISPGIGHLGEGPFSCMITGSGFMSGCTVEMESKGGEIFPATVSSVLLNSIQCSFTGRLDGGDRYLVRVRNTDDQISQEEVYFVVYGPPPMVTGINPNIGRIGDGALDISVTGSGFTDGCRIHLRDLVSGSSITNYSSTVVSDEGQVVTGLFDLTGAGAGSYGVYVENPDGQESVDEITFTVKHAAPAAVSVNPPFGLIGDSSLSLSVTGSGFTDGCRIHLRDLVSGSSITNLSSTVVSDEGQVVTGLFDLTGAGAGSYGVYVENPDGQESVDEITFTVKHAAPAAVSVNPPFGLIGDSSLSLSVTGSGFTDGCRIHLRDLVSGSSITNLSSTVVSDEGQVVTGLFDLTGVSAGSYGVYVENPDGQESADDVIFTVRLPVPVVYSVHPSSGIAGDSSLSLSVTGSGFTDGCSIHITDISHTITLVNISPTITFADGTCVQGSFDLSHVPVGSYLVHVVNPDNQVSDEKIIFQICEPSKQKHDIHITAGQGGSTIPNGLIQVPVHSDLRIHIQPDSGYRIQNVYLDTTLQGPLNELLLTDIITNHSVFVDFSKNDPHPTPFPTVIPTPLPTKEPEFCNLYVTAEYGGIIMPNGTIRVKRGSDVPFEFVSHKDFTPSYLQVDNDTIPVNISWTLQSVQSDHTIRLISDRKISPYWAEFNVSSVTENDTREVMFTSDYYPDSLWESWSYGDGSITYGRPMNHSYTSPGTYSVSHQIMFRNSTSSKKLDLIVE